MIHWIAHLLGWNSGRVISKIDDDGNIWIAFQCAGCGVIKHKHISRKQGEL